MTENADAIISERIVKRIKPDRERSGQGANYTLGTENTGSGHHFLWGSDH